MKRPALQNRLFGVLRIAIRTRKVFGTFEKRPLNGDSKPDLCDSDAVFHQLSYQANLGAGLFVVDYKMMNIDLYI